MTFLHPRTEEEDEEDKKTGKFKTKKKKLTLNMSLENDEISKRTCICRRRRRRNIYKDALMTNCNDAAFYKFAFNDVFSECPSAYML